MSSQLLKPNHEAAIWARLLQEGRDETSPEAAEYLLSIGFGESDRERMSHLAELSEAGALSDDERTELDGYLHIWNFLAVMQSRARVALRKPPNHRNS